MATPSSARDPPKQCVSLRDMVKSLYPDARRSTYCVPPMHFSKTPLSRRQVPGTQLQAFQLQNRSDPETKTKKVKKKKKSYAGISQPSASASIHGASSPGGCQPEASCQLHLTSPDEPPGHGQSPASSSKDSYLSHTPTSLWTMETEESGVKDLHVQESDVQGDFAQNHVLLNLQKLGEDEQEVMFIVSQLEFINYLNKIEYCARVSHLPKPQILRDDRGDFDILIISRRLGILIGELKSFALSPDGSHEIVERPDSVLAKKVEEIIGQLEKSERTIRSFLSDIPDLFVRKTIFLPYVTSVQFRRVLSANEELKKNLCQILDVTDGSAATDLCCCHEQISHPTTYWNVEPSLSELKSWWKKIMPRTSAKDVFNDETYLDIVARFVGPATSVVIQTNIGPRVEVRTAGEAVSEFGRRLARLVLTPQQLHVLQEKPKQVCLTGPPGTGKTLMLVLMGLIWLQAGHDVYIICTYTGSLAVSYLIKHQLTITAKPGSPADPSLGTVHFKYYDVVNDESIVDTAVEELSAAAAEKGGDLRVLIDEVKFTTSDISGPQTRLVEGLNAKVKDPHIWTVCLGNESIPRELEAIPLTVPLRCAPVLQREIHSAISTFKINEFTRKGVTAPGDGMDVKRIVHQGDGHSGKWPLDCVQCGREVASQLRAYGVGTSGTNISSSPKPLKYRDVFVLTRSYTLRDGPQEDQGGQTPPASGLVQGLRAAGLPVKVIKNRAPPDGEEEWKLDLEDVATAGTDHIVVAHHINVSGLERKLLVWVLGLTRDHEEGVDEQRMDARDRLYVVSRGTTQLVKVDVPSNP